MRHRAPIWRQRPPFASWQLGGVRTITTRRQRAFTKRKDEDGNIYYTVATKEEGKDLPKQLEADELFGMPDLVLDLDAAGTRHVREVDAKDEERLNEKWRTTEKRATVAASMKRMSAALAQSRKAARQMASTPTHSTHISDQDIMSAALRGMGALETQTEAPQNEEGSSNRLVITTLTQRHHDLSEKQLPAAARRAASQDVAESNVMKSGLEDFIKLGDPRRSPDYMEHLRLMNGVSATAKKDDEKLIRWLLLRHDSNAYVKEKSGEKPPTAEDVAAAIKAEEPTQRSILNIRRIVFQSLSLGSDLSIVKVDATGKRVNVPLEIRDACVRILDASADDQSSHYEVLTFANNLGHRLPQATGDMAACIYGLRLRSLAGLGLTDLTIGHLKMTKPDIWDGDVDVLSDVQAALYAWTAGLKKNSVLQTQNARQQLFRAVTGLGGIDTPLATSYRSLIFHSKKMSGKHPQPAFLEALRQYLNLLAQLGAVNTLHKEWSTLAQAESPGMANSFQWALKVALQVAGVSGDGEGAKKLSLEECARLDYSAIRARGASAESSSEQAWTGGLLGKS